MSQSQFVTALRQQLSTGQPDTIRQGLALLEGLNSPSVTEALLSGVTLSASGHLRVPSDAPDHLQGPLRWWVALGLLRISGALNGVERLSLRGRRLLDLSPLEGLSSLRSVALGFTDDIPPEPLTPLCSLPALSHLELHTYGFPCDLSLLPTLALCSCALVGHWELADIAHIGQCVSLQALELEGLNRVTDISALSALTNLHTLRLTELHELGDDLSPLRALERLERLELGGAYGITELSALAGLQLLELSLVDLELSDISALSALPALKRLEMRETLIGRHHFSHALLDNPEDIAALIEEARH